MKWLIPMAIGAASGWLVAHLTDEIAVAAVVGAAIGVLTTVALSGRHSPRTFAVLAIAMAIGALSGWLIASVTNEVAAAMALGAVLGVFATGALSCSRPLRSLLKMTGSMVFGFAAGCGIGFAAGDHVLGLALAIPLALPLMLYLADSIAQPRYRPF